MKTIQLLFWFSMPLVLHGQSTQARIDPPFKSVAGAFFALSVSDMAGSVKWYSEALGLKVVLEFPKRNGVAVTVLEGAGLTVELIQRDGAVPLGKAAPDVTDAQLIHGLFKVGIVVEQFDQTVAQLRSRGVEIAYGPFPARANQKANVLIRDNAGNLIQIFGR